MLSVPSRVFCCARSSDSLQNLLLRQKKKKANIHLIRSGMFPTVNDFPRPDWILCLAIVILMFSSKKSSRKKKREESEERLPTQALMILRIVLYLKSNWMAGATHP